MAADDISQISEAPMTGVPFMFPLMLNITNLPIMLIGGGQLRSRISMLKEYTAGDIHIFSSTATDSLTQDVGLKIYNHLPMQKDFERICPRLVFVMDLEDEHATRIRAWAKSVGALVHVHDRIALCDFHLPARVRRGHLQITVSTDGTVAGLSRLIREFLEKDVFGPEWSDRVYELASQRLKWKKEGLSFESLALSIREFVSERRWLKRD